MQCRWCSATTLAHIRDYVEAIAEVIRRSPSQDRRG